jgi:hypothetical protein
MATLTSTITISGTINGRKISSESTMTLTDIYDAGIIQPADGEATYSTLGIGAAGSIRFAQDCPSFLCMVNRSPSEVGVAQLTNAGGASDFQFVLCAGQFLVLNEYTNGAGLMTINASGTNIALEEIQAVQFDTVPDIGFVVKGDSMVAFQAAS